uniref:MET transcriptional regulator MACC1 n=1 Tax=Paramormyrops kingsleyae TaxID=1676925 RepID=A0A3B3S5Z5_9TELE|nr:metastasis-associated in colon cancer protein 1-like isoform X1 [Paramormyrops kingsleyae]XP_023658264.1 metastasis-associated in colon cancer protein 1-like isoform X1 [Paramormyrops kingsleyae]XP_023658265.1 metastasis-associated in colon cancer protein 1-like isoform X1 [Paramormyrops kingsleyae]
MTAIETMLRHTSSLLRSRSEGMLIDFNEDEMPNKFSEDIDAPHMTKQSDVPVLQPEVHNTIHKTNPFWNGLSGSNPFLDDIVHTDKESRRSIADVSILKEDPSVIFGENNVDFSNSSDEANFGQLFSPIRKNKSERRKSASDILDVNDETETEKEASLSYSSQLLNPDFEWLKDDREAYKMAWLSHRQLTRSCLDLGSTSPGWAQTQASETQIVCKIGHSGGSVQLPNSDISVYIPEGHVLPGEMQEIGLKAVLDPPIGLCNDLLTVVSPLLEVSLSNINMKTSVSLLMKISGEVKNDPLSQVMTQLTGLVSHKRDGPFQKIKHCYLYNNTLQMKIENLKPHMYIIAAMQATILQPPATSVWDYMNRHLTIGVYGPRHIHPSFKAVCVVSCHSEIPKKLPFSNSKRGPKNLPPLVLQLWGKQNFSLNGLKDLYVTTKPMGTTFEVRAGEQIKVLKKEDLKTCQVFRLPFSVSMTVREEVVPFKLVVKIKDSKDSSLTEFQVQTPGPVRQRTEKFAQKRLETFREKVGVETIPEETIERSPKFQDRPVCIKWYGVTLKSVIHQPRVEYLLDYIKGETVAILSRDTVKSVGQSKVKEWYIAFLRGRVGLLHSKNVKVIPKDQVIDFTDVEVKTQVLLDNIAIPFKKLTYVYSTIETLVTEHVSSWRTFAEALGYSNLSLDEIVWRQIETESEKVACVLEKLKEDCHSDKNRKKFQHELIVGLLKMDAQDLVSRLTQNTVILSTAVELGVRWRELAEKLGKLSSAQIARYETPHQDKSGQVSSQSMWKPAYDFLYMWSSHYGEHLRDLVQDLHLALDKMKTPITRQWREITGVLITVNCMEILQGSAFSKP